jgi:hypothetical protein
MRLKKEKGGSRAFLKTLFRKFAPGIIAISCVFSQCVFNTQVNEQPLTITSLDTHGDTISVFPKLRFVFSTPLEDSSVPPKVAFSPAVGSGYGAFLNANLDTFTIDFMEMLEGNTKYVFKIISPVTSASGSVWDLSEDSVIFYTYPREQEANDTRDLADTLTSIIFGSISDGSDIDAFVCSRKNIKAVYFQSLDCRDSFFVEDSFSNIFPVPGTMRQRDTISFSPSAVLPVFIFVRSGIKGFEGNYQLGVIEQ